MLKIFREGLAVETSGIVGLTVGKDRDCGEENFVYYVEASLKNGAVFELEYFETQEDAESYVAKIVAEINAEKS